MISEKKRFIFLHISKTGGTSIAESLSHIAIPTPDKHISAMQCKHTYKDKWLEYFTFSFVRNPYDRISSYYMWRKNNAWGYEAHTRTFIEWLMYVQNCRNRKCKDIISKHFSLAIRQQFDILAEDNVIMLDFIGRFETLQSDFDKICNTLGIQRNALPHINKQACAHYSEYYNDETRNLVRELYQKDIDYFGYDFESV